MNLVGKAVTNEVFGEGTIVRYDGNYITVLFVAGEKNFQYPEGFDKFLKIKDEAADERIKDEIVVKEAYEKELADFKVVKKEEDKRKEALIELKKMSVRGNSKSAGKTSSSTSSPRVRSASSSKSGSKSLRAINVAFKCNFCDGGNSEEQIGYNGVCSFENLKNNVEKESRAWCSSEGSDCLKYFNGDITRKTLDGLMLTDGGFVCYESQMLRDWKAFAGVVQKGESKGAPMKLKGVRNNSLCILTSRYPGTKEAERLIFAVFLVGENFEGDYKDAGYVLAKDDYRIKLSENEAKSMLYWDYHANDNQSAKTLWATGLHRYFEDVEAAQILRDIVKVKQGSADESDALDMFEHFCKVKSIVIDTIPEATGARIPKTQGDGSAVL